MQKAVQKRRKVGKRKGIKERSPAIRRELCGGLTKRRSERALKREKH